ncbi:MAG TPA: hypothetical protein VD970_15385 [Acetobacteraceae bacterium]|nr:hypothetical protein [Acetobacteraceae bacterium]
MPPDLEREEPRDAAPPLRPAAARFAEVEPEEAREREALEAEREREAAPVLRFEAEVLRFAVEARFAVLRPVPDLAPVRPEEADLRVPVDDAARPRPVEARFAVPLDARLAVLRPVPDLAPARLEEADLRVPVLRLLDAFFDEARPPFAAAAERDEEALRPLFAPDFARLLPPLPLLARRRVVELRRRVPCCSPSPSRRPSEPCWPSFCMSLLVSLTGSSFLGSWPTG